MTGTVHSYYYVHNERKGFWVIEHDDEHECSPALQPGDKVMVALWQFGPPGCPTAAAAGAADFR